MALNKKHLEFVNNYFLFKMNQTDAYQATYPKASRESARRLGSQLLTNIDIREEIQARLDEQKMSADEVLAEWAAVARGDMADFITLKDGVKGFYLDLEGANKKGLMKLVKKLKYNANGQPEIELHDKLTALDRLGKHHGLLIDRQEVQHSGSIESKLVVLPSKDE